MADQIKESALNASATILRPLVEILRENRVSKAEFLKHAEAVFLDAAMDSEHGASISSRLVNLLGLADTKTATVGQVGHQKPSGLNFNRVTRVISGWRNDSRFTENDEPRNLKLFDVEASFRDLVEEYGEGVPFSAMLSLMESAEIVEICGEEIKLKKSSYIPNNESSDKFDILGSDVVELIATINNNLNASKSQKKFQRKVTNICVSPVTVKHFKKYMALKSQRLLEDLDEYLSQHEVPAEGDKTTGTYVSVGIYYYDEKI